MATASKRRLVIVESPTKAVSLAKFLGAGYMVESSRGHVRDLPTGAAEVPAKYKGEKWARTGVNIENDFEPLYVVAADKKATMRDLKAKLADADELLLATDEDREGEAIAWHLLDELKPKIPVKRMVFHEITPQAITEAVANTRDLDTDLVDAQETRRILDRLYGYEVSPVLWKKVMPKLSAGRVQSVATRLVVDRERERIAFRAAGYADIEAILDAGEAAEPRTFTARLTNVGTHRVAQGRDFDARGRPGRQGPAPPRCQRRPRPWHGSLELASYAVGGVEAKAYTRRPYAAVPHHDAAAGGRSQARLHRPADHVGGPGPVRARLHHLYAYRLGDPVRARRSLPRGPGQGAVRRAVPARAAPRLHLEGEERPRGARGDPSGRREPSRTPQSDRSARRPVPALRTDLEAHHRLADEGRRGRRRSASASVPPSPTVCR